MSYSPGRAAFNPDPVTLQAEKEKYMLRIQENQQKEHDQQQAIKVLTNEVEELNLKLSYLSIELAKREDECSRQTSTIQKLTNQRDLLQDKVLLYEKQLSVSNNLDTALKNLGDSSFMEENKSLKIQLAAVQQEADVARQEIVRMKAEFDLKEAGYRILEPQDHTPHNEPHNRERAIAPDSENHQSGTNHADPAISQQQAPTIETKRETAKVEPPKPKKNALPDSPILFELPSLKRFPVSRRDTHVLSTVREDGYLNPKFSPSLPHRPPDISVAPTAVAPTAATAAASEAATSSAAAPPDPTAVAEAQRRLDAALTAQREHGVAAPAEAAANGAGRDHVRVVVHSGRHLPKIDTFGSIDGFVRLELRRDAASADAPATNTQQTDVIKNDLNPDWGKDFNFEIDGEKPEKALILTLLDWERLGKPRPIGAVQVPIRWLRECRSQNGLFALKSPDGSPVTGKDGQPAALHLEMHYHTAQAPAAPADPRALELEAAVDTAGAPPPPSRPLAPAPAVAPRAVAAAGGLLPWRLKVCLQRAVNLPKMDLIGSADPYVNIQLGTQKFKVPPMPPSLPPPPPPPSHFVRRHYRSP
jgi:hypothetical protein